MSQSHLPICYGGESAVLPDSTRFTACAVSKHPVATGNALDLLNAHKANSFFVTDKTILHGKKTGFLTLHQREYIETTQNGIVVTRTLPS